MKDRFREKYDFGKKNYKKENLRWTLSLFSIWLDWVWSFSLFSVIYNFHNVWIRS
jgi:hypothetical protein